MSKSFLQIASLTLAVSLALPAPAAAPEGPEWHSLFNGKDLSGWTPKFAKHPLGENYQETFRVEDGVIKVSYDRWKKFDMQFGHLYSNQAYSQLRAAARVPDHRQGGRRCAVWGKLNSGVMVHSQSPLTLKLDQAFPVSMEVQFLAAGTTAGKQTGNAVSPGTNLERNGKLVTDHIIDSTSKLLSAR